MGHARYKVNETRTFPIPPVRYLDMSISGFSERNVGY